ncbi:hypothetical protein GCM10010433_33470 [Streptomyces pulveraceus]
MCSILADTASEVPGGRGNSALRPGGGKDMPHDVPWRVPRWMTGNEGPVRPICEALDPVPTAGPAVTPGERGGLARLAADFRNDEDKDRTHGDA